MRSLEENKWFYKLDKQVILWVNIFVYLAKYMRKSSDLLDSAFSVISEHLFI